MSPLFVNRGGNFRPVTSKKKKKKNFLNFQEFDFEKNLALFNKRLVFDEIDATNQPDVIRLVDINRKKPAPPVFIGESNEPKYRNDQNVIEGAPINYRQIKTNQKG